MIGWLKDAVFYEIYPQSFRDTNWTISRDLAVMQSGSIPALILRFMTLDTM